LEDFKEALSVSEKQELATKSVQLDPYAFALQQRRKGEALLGLGRAAEALPLLEAFSRWRTTHDAGASDPESAGTFVLAQALWRVGKDRQRALQMAKDAAVIEATSPRLEKVREHIRAWLDERTAT